MTTTETTTGPLTFDQLAAWEPRLRGLVEDATRAVARQPDRDHSYHFWLDTRKLVGWRRKHAHPDPLVYAKLRSSEA
jgi:hypothetical protein